MAGEHTGEFLKKEKSVSGNWSIEKDGDSYVLKIDDSFKSKSGPDLKIFLSPLAFKETNGKNATKGSLLVSPLKKTKGEQVYALPKGIELSAYKSLLIHCEKYSILWGGNEL